MKTLSPMSFPDCYVTYKETFENRVFIGKYLWIDDSSSIIDVASPVSGYKTTNNLHEYSWQVKDLGNKGGFTELFEIYQDG